MRIAVINATGGGMSGGYKQYLQQVLPRLAVRGEVEALLCATPKILDIATWFPPLHNVSFVTCASFRSLRHKPDRILKQAVAQFIPDILFIPVERYIKFSGIPLVVMMQNMGPLRPSDANPLSERIRYVLQRYEARFAVKKADRVVAPSQFVADFLMNDWRVSHEHIATIHYGSNAPIIDIQKPDLIPQKWQGNFLFTAGSIEPYRGLEDILEAIEVLRMHPALAGLVIAGFARWNMQKYKKKLVHWIEQKGLAKKIFWVGILREKEMSWCYQHCSAFIMTSRIESFGMIGLEALAHGCFCIIADNPPLPEIFDTAAWYYPPKNSNILAEKIKTALSLTSNDRWTISERARQHAATFSWNTHTDQLVGVLRKAIDDGARYA